MEILSLTGVENGNKIHSIMSDRFVVAIDLGGTWIRAGLVRESVGLIWNAKRLTKNNRSAEDILADIVSLAIEVRDHCPKKEIEAVGIGVPSTFSPEGGLDPCANLPSMGGFPLKHRLLKALRLPIFLENDAKCFTLGEWHFRRRADLHLLAGLTLGTSVGLGVVMDGVAYRGATGRSGEIWRSPVSIRPQGGANENLDSLLSGQALEDMFARASGSRIPGQEIFVLAERGNHLALATFKEYGLFLGRAMSWICDMLDPDLLVIGGAIAIAFAHILPGINDSSSLKNRKIVASERAEQSALQGAANMIFQTSRDKTQ
jgi:predicted NBD/HSP70 family sugar kinase